VRILTARWVFPVARPPIPDGAVALDEGRIIAVGPRKDIAAAVAGGQCWDLGGAVLLPGLVNCHTHLEIDAGPSGPAADSFVPWVQRVMARRKGIALEEQARIAETGARALLRCGTTAVGEVSTTGQSLAPLLQVGPRGVIYREILGLDPAEAPDRLAAAAADVCAMATAARGSRLAIGLSPHSAYALSEELLSACGPLARATGVPPAIHAAESPAETEFLTTGAGPIVRSLYPAVGCAAPPPRRRARSPIAYLAEAGALGEQPVLVHAVHVDEDDCRLMARHGVRVAHCPRSNTRLSEGTAPVPLMRTHGIPVGLGTDSLASAPDLDLWNEMRAAWAANTALTPAAVLEMATLGGARVLGMADRVGTLEIGKRADVIAVAADRLAASDPVGSLLEHTREEDVLVVLIEGAVRHHRCEMPRCA
jgi:5-methylthioadenosine/S-adenosylhomocysteine deaminase